MKKYLFLSERLGFRTWKEEDIQVYAEMNQDPEVMKYFPQEFWLDHAKSAKSIEGFMNHYHQHGFTYFAVDVIDENRFIGFIGMKTISYDVFFAPAIDIGWRLRKDFWGRGYATEGAKRCVEFFFENFKYDRLVSLTPTKNKASWNIMEKIGMQKITTFMHPMVEKDDPLSEHVLYELTIERD